ncbi:MAG: peptidylprolyl isomerase [Nanoarchaeota archaeon]|nr:peptidylprolyl isomerase [Nanoarchaeota archaeon]
MLIKKGDFVNIEYTGKYNGKVFDTTNEEIAKQNGIYSEKTKYGPVTIVVGAGHLIKGIDEALIGKKPGDSFNIKVPPEKAFGKKNPKLLKIIPEKIFKEQKITPMPGMSINVDGIVGNIVSVGGGRVIVDFNHPLAGKELEYDIKINKIVEDKKEKIKALIELYTGIEDAEIDIKDNEVLIKAKEISQNVKDVILKDIKKYIGIEKVKFEQKK